MADLATAVTVLDANGRAGVPSLLISGPGMGKSRLVRGLAAADGVLCKTVLGSLREPSDFAGLPVVRENGVTLERSEEHTSELQSLMRISYAVFCLKQKHTMTRHNEPTREI